MSERLTDAIDELANPNKGDKPPEPQSHPDPAARRPRLFRNTPTMLIVVLVLAAAIASGWATCWALGLPAVRDGLGKYLPPPLARLALAVVIGLVVGGLIAWLFRPTQTLRRGFRNGVTWLRRRTARAPLLVSLIVAALIGLAAAAFATRAISGRVLAHPVSATPVDVVKAALPAIVALIVALAVVVGYRRQRDSERAQFAHRFGAASAQLGSPDVAVRIAGVYAMAAVADESTGYERRQRCIDVLCGYLRLPYDPESGSNHLTEFVSTTTWSATAPATNIEEQRRQAIRQNDGELRKTIVRVITRHLRSDADTSWSANDFDFTDVLFELAPFAGTRFVGRYVSFDGATFGDHDDTEFDGAVFSSESVTFDGAKFESGYTSFEGTCFTSRSTSFDGATFSGPAISFDGARFTGEYVTFQQAGFLGGETSFEGAKFKCLHAAFDSPAAWNNIEFDWETPQEGGSPSTVPRCISPRPWPPSSA
jgi:Pentapeptide repeats (9 copies)